MKVVFLLLLSPNVSGAVRGGGEERGCGFEGEGVNGEGRRGSPGTHGAERGPIAECLTGRAG